MRVCFLPYDYPHIRKLLTGVSFQTSDEFQQTTAPPSGLLNLLIIRHAAEDDYLGYKEMCIIKKL